MNNKLNNVDNTSKKIKIAKKNKKIERSYITINLSNLKYNYNNIKEKMYPNEKMACVVKANAYGHGDLVIASELEKLGVDFFCVATLEEGINLRKVLNVNTKILILGYTPCDHVDKLIKYDLIQTITSRGYMEEMYKHTSEKVKVHLAIDTGMSRIGLQINENLERNIEFALKHYNVDGAFTHISSADSLVTELCDYSQFQMLRFNGVYEKFNSCIENFHYKNSASIIRQFKEIGNYVRPGIILYGLAPSNEISDYIDLKQLIEWKSVISSVRDIPEGTPIGYGNTYKSSKQMKVATISTGYADGYNRLLSNKGYVLINGKKARVVGRICMDQFMVDVTDIEDVHSGMMATLIGQDMNEYISIDELAKLCDTINYEIVCSITSRVKRYYI